MITTALSPNLESDDLWLSLQLLMQPWRWQHGKDELKLDLTLQNYFRTNQVWSVNSGRTALLTILQALKLQSGDEVLLQAFTCNAVCNPIRWAGGQPVYVDIDADTLNISVDDLTKKITTRSKVLIIQHTFGNPADLTPLLALAKQHHLFVIEDCAHALGARHANQLLGTFGDAAIFSFGRDKIISSVYGGALLVNNKNLKTTVEPLLAALPHPKLGWTLQQLLHPLMSTLGRHIPGFLTLAQKLKIISLAVSRAERSGLQPNYFPTKLPNALATLALRQLQKLDRFNQHRQQIAQLYHANLKSRPPWLTESIWLRYSVWVDDPQAVFTEAKQAGMILGDWYWSVIVPTGPALSQYGYQPGSCPVAEWSAQHIINLPTHIRLTTTQAQQISNWIKPHLHYGSTGSTD